ncbi:MAG: PIN domain-containing protein [Lewinellaceae bacterium]|nr:PIN domain-containing protein [Lewinellaceae bacterium]
MDRSTAILDACVLYPAPLRDLLLNLGANGLFIPKWSEIIQSEWTKNLLDNRPDLSSDKLQRTVDLMNTAFPDANVEGFEDLVQGLKLPDPGDHHVLAAAIRCKADVIVTSNLQDFPVDYLTGFDLEALHPDSFICNLIDQDPEACLKALNEQAGRLRNPPQTVLDVLGHLEKNGLEEAVRRYRALLR